MRQPHHGRGGSRHVGRIRIAASKIIEDSFPGVHVRPEDIVPATGRCRTDWRQDIYRWEFFGRRDVPGGSSLPYVVQSWQRLTDFVRNAKAGGKITIDSDDEIYCAEP